MGGYNKFIVTINETLLWLEGDWGAFNDIATFRAPRGDTGGLGRHTEYVLGWGRQPQGVISGACKVIRTIYKTFAWLKGGWCHGRSPTSHAPRGGGGGGYTGTGIGGGLKREVCMGLLRY